MCISKYSKSRLVYELIGEKYFVEELKVKFKLETTNAYQKFIEIRNNKNDDIPLSFYSTPAFKTNVWKWKSSNCADRNMFTRNAIHGFHHLICNNKRFHDCNEKCICTVCNLKCERYHLLKCKDRFLS
jgi:hypothetical protein